MAKVLSAISLDAPSSPVSANVNDTFEFTGTPSFGGGGGVQRYDFKWEVDSGGGFVTIGTGTGLDTSGTNPLVNTNSQTANSITVDCSEAGSYTVRIVGAPTSGGSYTVVSATQTVEVSSGPEEHFGTLSVTGGGSADPVAQKGGRAVFVASGGGSAVFAPTTGRPSPLSVAGGGSLTVSSRTGRSLAATVSGGGSVSLVGESGTEQHSGTLSVSGGGSLALAPQKAANLALTASGGGSLAASLTTSRSWPIEVSGGGSALFAPTASRSIVLSVTGGGSVVSSGLAMVVSHEPPFQVTVKVRAYAGVTEGSHYQALEVGAPFEPEVELK